MGTYIIHFDDKPWQDLDDELYYRCFEIPWFSTTKTTISRLTPYTEDSAYVHGYTKAESKYREIRDELEKQAYQRGYETAKRECEDCTKPLDNGKAYQQGLTDAWEAARKIGCFEIDGGYPITQMLDLFNRDDLPQILSDYTASEAIEKIRQYEEKQEEEIQVGDEVVGTYTGEEETEPFVIIRKTPEIYPTYYFGIYSKSGEFCQGGLKLKKTGRHFPEIAEVLRKMKETDNG